MSIHIRIDKGEKGGPMQDTVCKVGGRVRIQCKRGVRNKRWHKRGGTIV